MNENIHSERYYSKQKYEASIGAFVIGIIFVLVAILSFIFMRTNINFLGLRRWGYWMLIPAFFIFIAGFYQVYINSRYKKAVKNALSQRGNEGTHKLEHIAIEIGIKPKDLLRVLLDLRNKNMVKYKFNPDTGEIVLGESVSYTPPVKKPEVTLAKEDKSFCVYCGQKLDGEAIFCPSCGSKL